MSITSRHVPFAKLADLVEGRLAPDEQEQRQHHVSACLRCRAEVAWLERIIGLMRTDTAADPPPYVVDHVVHIFRSRSTPPPPGPVRRIMAILRFDSARRPMAPGVRAGLSATQQLLFYAEEHELDLRITPADSLWVVAGQVLGPEGGGQVELQSPTASVHAVLNDLCEFTLPPVPAGSYRLTLHLTEIDIEIAWLEVG